MGPRSETSLSIDLGLVLFALVAALSPMALAATLAVVKAGRLQALLFAIAIVASQFAVAAILISVGGLTLPHRNHGYPTARALLEIGFAVCMLVLAARVRRRRPDSKPHRSVRTKKLLDRLERVNAGTALVGGLLLGVGGPKRLVLTALAAATIATASSDGYRTAVQLALYTLVATILVWVPVSTFLLFDERAQRTIDSGGQWLARRQQKVVFVGLVALAVAALASAASQLL